MISTVSLQQGTVRSIEDYSIGLITIETKETPAAELAVWPNERPQEHRNDFLTKFSAQAGDLIPIGGQILRVVAVVPTENGGHVQFEEERSKQISLNPRNFYIIFKGTGELHGIKIEFSELEKQTAILEMWPNDYEKDAAIKQSLVKPVSITVGKELQIADRSYKVVSINESNENMLGWVEFEL